MQKVMFILLSLLLMSSVSCNDSETFDQMAHRMASQFDAPVIKSSEVKELKGKAILLDARETSEFMASHLEGALFVGFNSFDFNSIKGKLAKDKNIVVYCSVGYRSGKIAELLKKKGYKVFNLFGGIFNWVNKGENVYNYQGVTSKVHGYNKDWSKWLTKGDIVY